MSRASEIYKGDNRPVIGCELDFKSSSKQICSPCAGPVCPEGLGGEQGQEIFQEFPSSKGVVREHSDSRGQLPHRIAEHLAAVCLAIRYSSTCYLLFALTNQSFCTHLLL